MLNGTPTPVAQDPSSFRKENKLLPFHPLADMFPLMEDDEFDELVADIQRRGLCFPITTFEGQIIDGRNRARASQKAGVEPRYVPFEGKAEDVPRFIISANIHRRHLKPEQRKDLLKRVLYGNPEQSDRAIGTLTRTDHKTVGAVRRELEATGEIPQLTKTVGADGKPRNRPEKKINSASKPAPEKSPVSIRGVLTKTGLTDEGNAEPRETVAPDEEVSILREFALFVINTAKSVSVDPKDRDQWRSLRGRTQAILRAGAR